jgi:hypothetical protein
MIRQLTAAGLITSFRIQVRRQEAESHSLTAISGFGERAGRPSGARSLARATPTADRAAYQGRPSEAREAAS